jgi:hypothetical protein
MKTQKLAKIRRTRGSAQVGDTLIYEDEHPEIEHCQEWRVVYITPNNTAILVSRNNKDSCIFLDLFDVSGWLKITEH